jgi:hypothetical protein
MMKPCLNLVEYSSKMDLMILAMFAAGEYMNFSLNNWIGYIRPQMATSYLDFHAETISKIPREAFADILG